MESLLFVVFFFVHWNRMDFGIESIKHINRLTLKFLSSNVSCLSLIEQCVLIGFVFGLSKYAKFLSAFFYQNELLVS